MGYVETITCKCPCALRWKTIGKTAFICPFFWLLPMHSCIEFPKQIPHCFAVLCKNIGIIRSKAVFIAVAMMASTVNLAFAPILSPQAGFTSNAWAVPGWLILPRSAAEYSLLNHQKQVWPDPDRTQSNSKRLRHWRVPGCDPEGAKAWSALGTPQTWSWVVKFQALINLASPRILAFNFHPSQCRVLFQVQHWPCRCPRNRHSFRF